MTGDAATVILALLPRERLLLCNIREMKLRPLPPLVCSDNVEVLKLCRGSTAVRRLLLAVATDRITGADAERGRSTFAVDGFETR